MRKLFWFFIAIALATYTTHLWSTADPTATFVLRDGLLVALLAILITAIYAAAPDVGALYHTSSHTSSQIAAELRRARLLRTPATAQSMLTATGGVLLGTAVASLLVGQILPYLVAAPIANQSASILRWLGWGLLLAVVIGPQAWQQRWAREQRATSAAGVPWLALLFLLFVGGALRLLLLSRVPIACIGMECDLALALTGALPGQQPALPFLQLLYRVTGESLRAVRIGALLIGVTIPLLFYLAVRRLTHNGAALLGALLLTLTPWFALLDGSVLPTLLLLFWSCTGLWLLCEAYLQGRLRWALPAGVAFALIGGGLLLQAAIFLWLLLFALFTLWPARYPPNQPQYDDIPSSQPTVRSLDRTGLLLLVGFLLPTLPLLLQEVTQQMAGPLALLTTAAANAFDGTMYLYTLFQQGILADRVTGGFTNSYWQQVPPLDVPVSILGILGLGLYLRRMRDVPYRWLGSGTLIFGLLFFYTATVESMALFFLLMVMAATLALALVHGHIYQSWHPLLSYANTVALAVLLLFLVAVAPLSSALEAGQPNRSREMVAVEQAMIEQIASHHAERPNELIFAPLSLLQNPSARLRLGDEMLATIQPLSTLLNALYTTDEPQSTTYLIPVDAQPYLALIQRLQPGAVVDPQIDPATGELRFHIVTVNRDDRLAQQGLLGVAWENKDSGNASPLMLPALGPLQQTASELPISAPYVLQWSGALRVPIPGTYRIALDPSFSAGEWFTADETTADSTAPLLTMQLDDRLILDSSLGLLSQEINLAKGFYQLALNYQTAPETQAANSVALQPDTASTVTPLPFAIRWQRPDGIDEIIPRSVLSNLPLPNFGLIGDYFWGEQIAGEPFDSRKDLLVGVAAARDEPYTVRWQGQLAAARSGEYLLATLSAPGSLTQLAIDGIPLIDTAQVAEAPQVDTPQESGRTDAGSADTLYGEGTIYLPRGWHSIEVIHRPDDAGTAMQLLWQPPGSAPTMLDANYFVPTLTPLAEIDRGLPSAPPLSGEAQIDREDEGRFVLSYGTEFWHPQRQIPPGFLPQLPMSSRWQINSCGTGETQLDQPHGVAVSGIRRLIYVADTANRRIVEYTLDGTVNQIYSSPEWQEPFAVALIDDGFPVVLDATTQLLYDLNPITGVITPRPQRAGFYRPRGLAVDSAGNLLIADTGGGRVVQLSPAGDEIRAFGGQGTQIARGQPTGVAGAGGLLWAVTPEDGRLWQLESGGTITAIERADTLNGPHLAALPTGQLFLTDPTRRSLLYLAPTGQPLAQIPIGDFVAPTGVAAAVADDMLYLVVADSINCGLGLWQTALATLP